MKITRVKFKQSSQSIIGYRSQSGYIQVGDPTDPAWGSGTVTSLEYDRATHSLVIRKGSRFERKTEHERKTQPSFDVAMVAWDNVDCACGVEDAPVASQPSTSGSTETAQQNPPTEMPPAKPIEKQGQQRR